MPATSGLRVVAGLIALLAGLALGLWVHRSLGGRTPATDSREPSPVASSAAPKGREEVSVTRPVIRQTDRGRLAWQVRLKELRVAAGAEAITAAGLDEAVIYGKTGTPAIRLTAEQAKGSTADGSLEVSGNVRATTSEGALITTEALRWIEQERRLHCPGAVTVRTRRASLTTSGLSYYVDSDTVRAPGLVRVYSGKNKLMGRELVYNVATEAIEMRKVQAIFSPKAAQPAPTGR